MKSLTFKLEGHTVTTVRDEKTGWTTHVILDGISKPVSRIGVIGLHEAQGRIRQLYASKCPALYNKRFASRVEALACARAVRRELEAAK